MSSLQDEGSACLLGEADRPVTHCSIGHDAHSGYYHVGSERERERRVIVPCHHSLRPPLFHETPPLFARLAYSRFHPQVSTYVRKGRRNFPSNKLAPFESIGNVPISRYRRAWKDQPRAPSVRFRVFHRRNFPRSEAKNVSFVENRDRIDRNVTCRKIFDSNQWVKSV